MTAITGATIIDGNGGSPIQDGVILIKDGVIREVGSRKAVDIPHGANLMDARGKYIVPGFIDTNVHLDFSPELFPLLVYGGSYDTYLAYSPALEGAQMALKYGVTTILDTFGPLLTLTKLRDKINAGDVIGPRLLVAGNIIGLDGITLPDKSRLRQDLSDWYTQGTGSNLTQMYPDEVRDAVNRYLDLGPDFIKIDVTTHSPLSPIALNFSPRVLKIIVETAHARGLKVQAHSGSVEGHRESVEAGIDIITHAGSLYSQRLRSDFAREICASETAFALFAYGSMPPYEYLRSEEGRRLAGPRNISEDKVKAIISITPDRDRSPRLQEPLRSKLPGADNPLTAFRKENQGTLIKAGCKIVVASDSHPPTYDDIVGYAKTHADMGLGTINTIEGLVTQLGMTPAQAIVVATKSSAAAAGLASLVGTIEEGKMADMVLLDADPLVDILNIRKVYRVVHDGALLDPKALPVNPRFYKRHR